MFRCPDVAMSHTLDSILYENTALSKGPYSVRRDFLFINKSSAATIAAVAERKIGIRKGDGCAFALGAVRARIARLVVSVFVAVPLVERSEEYPVWKPPSGACSLSRWSSKSGGSAAPRTLPT